MDNYQEINPKVAVIRNSDLWIEETAVSQLTSVSQLAGMLKVCGMPDLHPGRTYPIGAAFFSKDKIYPALVGSDIGCGMSLWQTELPLRTNGDKLEKNIGNIDKPLDFEQASNLLSQTPQSNANGTIGSGNHFAEILQVSDIFQEQLAQDIGLCQDKLQLLIHSGSRGLGGEILQEHLGKFHYEPLQIPSIEAEQYLEKHQQALIYAKENRLLIAKRILANLKTKGVELLDITHNFVREETIAGVCGYLHRKGAAAAEDKLAVIPGSRGSFSYLVIAKKSDFALNSIAHGAGRKWKRSDCEARLKVKFSPEQLRRTKYKSRVICEDKALLYEEAPQAYKDIESVIKTLSTAGIIEVVARFTPVLTYKKRKDC